MNLKHFIFLFITLIVSSCNSKNNQNPFVDIQVTQSSDAYQAPFFRDKGRKARVLQLMPRIERLFNEYAEAQKYPAFIFGVMVDGELVFSEGKGLINLEQGTTVSPDSKFHIASMTKSLTAMAIIKLRDEGRLSLEDPVAAYIPELRELEYLTGDASTIKLFHLLTMSSGFPEDNPWADRHLEDTEKQFRQLMKGGPAFSNVPGYAYEYSNLGFAMLGQVISKVSGKPYQNYIEEAILKPLQMHDTYWEYEDVPDGELAIGYRWQFENWQKEPMLHTGAFGAIGGLITSLNDFSKYVAYLMSAWPPRSDAEYGPLKRGSLREMQTPFFSRLAANAKDTNGRNCPRMSGYGYGLAIQTDCRGITKVSHSGGLPGFGSQYTFLPDYGIGIISFANRTYAGTSAINQEALELLLAEAKLEPRSLPIANILYERSNQLFRFLQTWDDELADLIFADNFYLDYSREVRKFAFDELDLGTIRSMDGVDPVNQLRGTFIIRGDRGEAEVFFSLSPESDARVQALRFRKIK